MMSQSTSAFGSGKIGGLKTRQAVLYRSTASTFLLSPRCLSAIRERSSGPVCGETHMDSYSRPQNCESSLLITLFLFQNCVARLTRASEPALDWWSSQGPSKPNQPSNSHSFSSALQSSFQTISEAPRPEVKSDMVNRKKAAYDPGDIVAQTSLNRPDKPVPARLSTTATAGPAALPTPDPASPAEVESSNQIRFHFAPTMGPLLNPAPKDMPEGTDAWAFAKGYVSVTPIRAEYAALHKGGRPFGSDEPSDSWAGRMWE
jgi:hypothetical protein